MQWLVFRLCWSGDEGLVCMINLVCLGTTQIELGPELGMSPYEALYGRRCRTPVTWDNPMNMIVLGP